jgi:hypothetical protein
VSRRINIQTSKRRGPLSEVSKAHQQREGQSSVTRGKSSNPDYIKLTSYIRRDTHLAAKKRLLDDGGDLSELIERLLNAWLHD